MRSLVLLEKIPADKDGEVVHTNVEALDPRHTGGTGDYAITENFIFNSPAGNGDASPNTRKKALYALNVTGLAVRTFRQPLQVGIPKSSPIMFDVGSYRPLITVSGLVPREAVPVGQTVAFNNQVYYSPTFFQLQHAITQWNYVEGEEIILTVLHTNVASVTYDQYNVSIQNANLGLISSMPKFWSYELSFVAARPVSVNPSKNI
jgi:hypothetical protein